MESLTLSILKRNSRDKEWRRSSMKQIVLYDYITDDISRRIISLMMVKDEICYTRNIIVISF